MSEPLVMWTVYDNPRDLPGLFVAREFLVTAAGAVPTADTITCPELAPIRAALRREGLDCIDRQRGDEPHIVEVWL